MCVLCAACSISTVSRAVCSITQTPVIIKAYDKAKMKPKNFARMEREIRLMKLLGGGEGLVQLYTTLEDAACKYLVSGRVCRQALPLCGSPACVLSALYSKLIRPSRPFILPRPCMQVANVVLSTCRLSGSRHLQIMEYCKGGDLFKNLMMKGGTLDEAWVCTEVRMQTAAFHLPWQGMHSIVSSIYGMRTPDSCPAPGCRSSYPCCGCSSSCTPRQSSTGMRTLSLHNCSYDTLHAVRHDCEQAMHKIAMLSHSNRDP